MKIDMDDPWGSPWADEIHDQDIVPAKEVQRRPKTPVEKASKALNGQTTSLWTDDDDGFWEWAAVPEDKGRELGFDGADDRWDTKELEVNRGTVQGDSEGFTLAWDDTPTISHDKVSRLAPSPLPKPAELARQPSPDPWVTEANLNDTKNAGDKTHSESQKEDITVSISGPVEDASPAGNVSRLGEELPGPGGASPEKPKSDDGNVEDLDIGSRESEKATSRSIEMSHANSVGQEADPESSRPSSSPSDHSHHDEILQESPRTSFDEEPKRPQMPRKASSKVQELVQYFDGRAKQEEEPIVEATRQPAVTGASGKDNEPDAEDDEDDDFGDFEDGQSEPEEPIPEIQAQPTTSPVVEHANTALPAESSQNVAASPVRALKKDYGPVTFDVDISSLSKLYPDAPATPDVPAEKVFIPDTIPHDSFSSTDQRKTWYRVSRYGSMRKHNSGDDENYVRVNWPQSQVRAETLKIVGRWIEEDRISGRVVLGGGSKGSSMFGWNDPKATPVPLSTALASRKGKTNAEVTAPELSPEIPREWPKSLVRDRSASKSRSPSKSQWRSSAKSGLPEEVKAAPQAPVKSPPTSRRRSSAKSSQVSEELKPASKVPVASFGWSTHPEENFEETTADVKPGDLDWIQQLNIQPTASSSVPTSKPAPPAKKATSASLISASSTPTHSASAPLKQRAVTQPSACDDLSVLDSAPVPVKQAAPPSLRPALPSANLTNDDDDWGDMVSSPVTTSQPVLPPSKVLQHKKSQSLGGAFSFGPQNPISPQDTQTSQSGRGHKTTMSFDEILSPKIRSPAVAANANSFTNTFNSTSTPFPNGIDRTTNISASPPMTGTVDPWASADFSFFDSAPAPPPKPVPAPISKAPPARAVSFTSPTPLPPFGRNSKSREEVEQDKIVQNVVKGLPDLSYMLRR